MSVSAEYALRELLLRSGIRDTLEGMSDDDVRNTVITEINNRTGHLHDQATKLIALIRQSKIVVRDENRIHRFYPDELCSCQDHF
ncbi:unnamed protein product [Rotaria sp. Silwood2]|nr:unnamed protein product [Rotaria sp. Silwood2]CAF3107908.1 unnamed protein product [Rotaria sp. Silwood2]CAF3348264.1 unnamed protein product [Rotaria sp. Silwood2]CAF3433653.1 unnamed protein product [Rotaria sp. Silwood2]CAF4348681.1 unnamed protein product [Rotaria sp. Silwood2]